MKVPNFNPHSKPIRIAGMRRKNRVLLRTMAGDDMVIRMVMKHDLPGKERIYLWRPEGKYMEKKIGDPITLSTLRCLGERGLLEQSVDNDKISETVVDYSLKQSVKQHFLNH